VKHFQRLRSSIDPQPYLEEIASVEGAWSLSTGRQDKIQVQREALAIPLRGLRKSCMGSSKPCDVHESRWTSGSLRFPLVRRFLSETAAEREALPGRARLVCLPAGRRVYPHIDRGEYYRWRDRFHLVLRSAKGSWLRAGDEEIRMREGELWWFDNKQIHGL